MARTHAAGAGNWIHHLPFVLLGLRAAVREDSACSPADLVFGSSLRLPADLVDPSPPSAVAASPSAFVDDLRGILRQCTPMPFNYHGNVSSRVPASLASCSHVFIRVDAVRRPLTPPYEGPFEVLQRGTKTFIVKKSGKPYTVSVDRLKPALTLERVLLPSLSPSDTLAPSLARGPPAPGSPVRREVSPAAAAPFSSTLDPDLSAADVSSSPSSSPSLDPDVWPLPTRYGRRPRPPDRLNL